MSLICYGIILWLIGGRLILVGVEELSNFLMAVGAILVIISSVVLLGIWLQ